MPGGTRTSHNWKSLPGNFDTVHARELYPGTGPWGIPSVPADPVEPSRLIGYSDSHACADPLTGDAVHFFLDDYRFETVWTRPTRAFSRIQRVGTALTPDFSLWTTMPLAVQIWQVYRSRWCGAYMASRGIQVIPSVSWSDEHSYPFCFTGIEPGSTVAVSAVGTRRDREARRLFDAGCEKMCEALNPSLVLCYGKMPAVLNGIRVREYPVRQQAGSR